MRSYFPHRRAYGHNRHLEFHGLSRTTQLGKEGIGVLFITEKREGWQSKYPKVMK